VLFLELERLTKTTQAYQRDKRKIHKDEKFFSSSRRELSTKNKGTVIVTKLD
jgi:hypothetical protein